MKGKYPLETSRRIATHNLCVYAREAVGGGYCYGSSGEICTLSRRKQWAEWNPSQKHNLLGICAKWDGKRVWDCSGLFRGAWRALLTYKSGGATSIFTKWCVQTGAIETMPDEPSIAVFKGTEKQKEHVGLYIGGSAVVDARGASKGVVCGRIDSYRWTHWGRLADVDYDRNESALPIQAKVVNVKVGLNLRTAPVLGDNTICLMEEGAVVDLLVEDCGGGFVYVRYGDVLGYCTRVHLGIPTQMLEFSD